MAAWSICFYRARRKSARNLLPDKSLIPPDVESKMLEAAGEEGLPHFTEGVSDTASPLRPATAIS